MPRSRLIWGFALVSIRYPYQVISDCGSSTGRVPLGCHVLYVRGGVAYPRTARLCEETNDVTVRVHVQCQALTIHCTAQAR